MKVQQSVRDTREKVTHTAENGPHQPAQSEPEGGTWQLKALIVVLIAGVLMIIGKVSGLF